MIHCVTSNLASEGSIQLSWPLLMSYLLGHRWCKCNWDGVSWPDEGFWHSQSYHSSKNRCDNLWLYLKFTTISFGKLWIQYHTHLEWLSNNEKNLHFTRLNWKDTTFAYSTKWLLITLQNIVHQCIWCCLYSGNIVYNRSWWICWSWNCGVNSRFYTVEMKYGMLN